MFLPPISLYIHIPWCIKKCPYCDFNSHAQKGEIPEKAYIDQLIVDLKTQLLYLQNRPIHSIFIGGGTPSLFSPAAYAQLFKALRAYLSISDEIEITLEANPGAIDAEKFKEYFDTGINRLSIGVQSFQNTQLKKLGRIHESDQARNAVLLARQAGFKRINIDLMFGLPDQSINDALFDLTEAATLQPTHISWYQLTIEPNTFFHRFPPTLPDDEIRFEIQKAGQDFLAKNNFKQYEISAYAISPEEQSQHNLNYWLFGDYFGIGAGAHAKLTSLKNSQMIRRSNTKHPTQYLKATENNLYEQKIISQSELPLEFMMNILRLNQAIPVELFTNRTGLDLSIIQKQLDQAEKLNLLFIKNSAFNLTQRGRLFLNDVLEAFLLV